MNDDLINRIKAYIVEKYPDFHSMLISPSELIFEENVKMNCFYCGRYNENWKCPPKLPDIDYPKMMFEYEGGMFIWIQCPYDESNYQDVRNESSILLHKMLLDMEKQLWHLNAPTAISFIGGSCKLCKNGCGEKRCNNPYQSRTPLEAIGVNIIKSAKKYGIDITFPPHNHILRLGLLLWQ